MRSTALLASALAVGAIAKPLRHQHKRYVVTTVDLDVVTVTKYVTAGYEEPAPTPAAVSVPNVQHHHPHSDKPAPPASSAVYTPPPVVVSTPAYTPPASNPAPSSAAAPSSSQAATPSTSSGGNSGDYLSTQDTSGKSYADAIVYFHNLARKNHGHDDLVWDDSLASNAHTVAGACNFSHWSPVSGQGQNLFTASGSFGNVGSALFDSWYAGEVKNMTNSNAWGLSQISESTFEGSGHLTQMVWKGTQKVGCASVDCTSQGGIWMLKDARTNTYEKSDMNKFSVCQYSPPGNYPNEYANNVGKPKQLDIIMSAVNSKADTKTLISSLSKALGF